MVILQTHQNPRIVRTQVEAAKVLKKTVPGKPQTQGEWTKKGLKSSGWGSWTNMHIIISYEITFFMVKGWIMNKYEYPRVDTFGLGFPNCERVVLRLRSQDDVLKYNKKKGEGK